MADWYSPTDDEREFFNELVNEARSAGVLSEELVADLAGDLWASKVAAGKSIRVRVPGDTDWVEVHPKPSQTQRQPAAVSPQSPPEPEVVLDRRGLPLNSAVAEARRQFVDTYGGDPRGALVIEGSPELDRAGSRVFDAAGRTASAGGLDEQARREVDRLPQRGAVNYRGPKAAAKQLAQVHEGAAQRAAGTRQAARGPRMQRDALAGAEGRQDLTWRDIARAARTGQDLSTYSPGEHRPNQ
jgi:hypothetical protein